MGQWTAVRQSPAVRHGRALVPGPAVRHGRALVPSRPYVTGGSFRKPAREVRPGLGFGPAVSHGRGWTRTVPGQASYGSGRALDRTGRGTPPGTGQARCANAPSPLGREIGRRASARASSRTVPVASKPLQWPSGRMPQPPQHGSSGIPSPPTRPPAPPPRAAHSFVLAAKQGGRALGGEKAALSA